jgi:hypothetical protein
MKYTLAADALTATHPVIDGRAYLITVHTITDAENNTLSVSSLGVDYEELSAISETKRRIIYADSPEILLTAAGLEGEEVIDVTITELRPLNKF